MKDLFQISLKSNIAPTSPTAAANEEWPVIPVAIAALPQRPCETPTSSSSGTSPRNTDINIESLSTNDDLATLKKNDPFAYYSIPAVLDAEMQLCEVDITRLEKSSIRPRSISCPARMETTAGSEVAEKTVKRKTCISFECHADKLMMDSLLGDDGLDSSDNEDGFTAEDLLFHLLGSMTSYEEKKDDH